MSSIWLLFSRGLKVWSSHQPNWIVLSRTIQWELEAPLSSLPHFVSLPQPLHQQPLPTLLTPYVLHIPRWLLCLCDFCAKLLLFSLPLCPAYLYVIWLPSEPNFNPQVLNEFLGITLSWVSHWALSLLGHVGPPSMLTLAPWDEANTG